jgi:hypothetical protein
MSQELVSRSPDLKRLQDEEYEIEIKRGFLLVHHVPYVNANKEVKYGILASDLKLANDRTVGNCTHTIHFKGEMPCDEEGKQLAPIYNPTLGSTLFDDFTVDRLFSAKPTPGYYDDYYHKITTYIDLISGPAMILDNSVTAKTGRVRASEDDNSVFNYIDSNSTRANVMPITDKLRGHKIAIIGLGGTGSYILDFLAKTPVDEIHLFDGDTFLQHNAFRAPGAPSFEELGALKPKVQYLAEIYSKMRKNIVPHAFHMSVDKLPELAGKTFVFISIDKGAIKKAIIQFLIEQNIPFIDVGMGIEKVNDYLLGSVRTTVGTSQKNDHLSDCISFADDENDEYNSNIQISELNALNASFAVIKWKKMCGFYHDTEQEYNSLFTISSSHLLNEDITGA